MSNQPTPWHYSEAKQLLHTDIIDGSVDYDEMSDEEIYLSRPEYADYSFDSFKTYLKNLVEALLPV